MKVVCINDSMVNAYGNPTGWYLFPMGFVVRGEEYEVLGYGMVNGMPGYVLAGKPVLFNLGSDANWPPTPTCWDVRRFVKPEYFADEFSVEEKQPEFATA